jgi:hypothetical protein
VDQAPSTVTHTRIDSEVNPVLYNREGHINAILEVCGLCSFFMDMLQR